MEVAYFAENCLESFYSVIIFKIWLVSVTIELSCICNNRRFLGFPRCVFTREK
jgi:hypothetical protein